MERTIRIGGKEVLLNNNAGWAFEYRDQIGHDILPALLPLLASISEVAIGALDEIGKVKKLTPKDLGKLSGTGVIEDAMVKLAALEFTDLINITWAMAKNADDSIPEPRKWVKQFDSFPVDEIGPDVVKLILQGHTSSKNWARLQALMQNLKPEKEKKSTSTK